MRPHIHLCRFCPKQIQILDLVCSAVHNLLSSANFKRHCTGMHHANDIAQACITQTTLHRHASRIIFYSTGWHRPQNPVCTQTTYLLSFFVKQCFAGRCVLKCVFFCVYGTLRYELMARRSAASKRKKNDNCEGLATAIKL